MVASSSLAMLPVLLLIAAALVAYFFYARSSSATSKAAAGKHAASAAESKPTKHHKQPATKVDITAKSARKASDAAGNGAATSDASSTSSSSASSSSASSSAESSLIHRHLRGHTGEITGLAVSPDGRHIASVARDEQLRLWTVVDSEKQVHFARHNLKKGDFGSAVAISADDTLVAMAVNDTRVVHLFAISGDTVKNTGFLNPTIQFATPHRHPITTLRFAPNGAFLATMAESSSDLSLHLFTLKGTLIHSISVAQLVNYSFAISPDSRFIAAATKVADTKVWEVVYAKGGKGGAASSTTIEKIEPALSLKGQKRGLRSLSFTPDSHRIVAASLDGQSWIAHDIDVRYRMQEDARVVARVDVAAVAGAGASAGAGVERIDVAAPSGADPADPSSPLVVAVSLGSTLQFWRLDPVKSGAAATTLVVSIPHAHKGAIHAFEFNRPTSSKQRTQLVTTGEGKTITIWNLPKL